MKRFFIVFLFLVLILGGYVLFYMGALTEVKVTEKNVGPFFLVYREYVGDYTDVGRVIDEISNTLMRNTQIVAKRNFAVFYDDPEVTPVNELRSIVGVILEEQHYPKKGQISKFLGVKEYYKRRCVTCEFPYKNKFSIMLGPYRVYPVIQEYLDLQKYKRNEILEIYDHEDEKIEYAMPILR